MEITVIWKMELWDFPLKCVRVCTFLKYSMEFIFKLKRDVQIYGFGDLCFFADGFGLQIPESTSRDEILGISE